MKLTKKDVLFIAGIITILTILLFATARNKPGKLPDDDRHRPLLKSLAAGTDRAALERECASCHNPRNRALSKNHPPKEQCLLCHTDKD